MRVCPDCETDKCRDEFYPNPRLKSGLDTYCIPCRLARTKKSRPRKSPSLEIPRRNPRL